MTENNVIKQDDAEFERKLRAMAGQYVGGTDYIPKLSINRAPESKDGKELPVGAFTLNAKAYGRVFSGRKEAVQFRLYAKRYGYQKYDKDAPVQGTKKTGAIVARSVQLTDFKKGTEYISEDGTLKCGKASIPEGAKNPQVKTKIYFYGTVSFKGTNEEGKEVVLTDEPCFFMLGGAKFLEIDGYFKDFSKDGRRFFDYYLTLKPVYVQVGDGGVYNIETVFTDLTNRLEFNEEVFNTLQKFFDYIEANNKAIEVKFNAKLAGNADAVQGAEIVSGSDDLANDMIEEDDEQA